MIIRRKLLRMKMKVMRVILMRIDNSPKLML